MSQKILNQMPRNADELREFVTQAVFADVEFGPAECYEEADWKAIEARVNKAIAASPIINGLAQRLGELEARVNALDKGNPLATRTAILPKSQGVSQTVVKASEPIEADDDTPPAPKKRRAITAKLS